MKLETCPQSHENFHTKNGNATPWPCLSISDKKYNNTNCSANKESCQLIRTLLAQTVSYILSGFPTN